MAEQHKLNLLALRSQEHHRLASAISNRIKDFESWLVQLPSKQTIKLALGKPHEDLSLKFTRIDHEWGLFIDRSANDTGDGALSSMIEVAHSRLRLPLKLQSAPFDLKLSAADHFPTLVDGLIAATAHENQRLAKVHALFDKLSVPTSPSTDATAGIQSSEPTPDISERKRYELLDQIVRQMVVSQNSMDAAEVSMAYLQPQKRYSGTQGRVSLQRDFDALRHLVSVNSGSTGRMPGYNEAAQDLTHFLRVYEDKYLSRPAKKKLNKSEVEGH